VDDLENNLTVYVVTLKCSEWVSIRKILRLQRKDIGW
jgi:hypothetical protein